MNINEAMLIEKLPTLDLHGETADVSRVLINDFINDNIIMKNGFVIIIFGNGQGILRNAVYQELSKNKRVLEFKSHYNNRGSVVIHILI